MTKFKGLMMVDCYRQFSMVELKKLAAIVPGATYNYIFGNNVIKKLRLRMPSVIEGIRHVICPNPSCVTNPEYSEGIPQRFKRYGEKCECRYCGQLYTPEEIWRSS